MNEFRHQPLHNNWALIAPNRVRRPTLDAREPDKPDSSDPFISGSESKTPQEIYAIRENDLIAASWQTRVFANKFPLLALETPPVREFSGVCSTVGGFGAHEMVIDNPKPHKHLCQFSALALKNLMQTFRDRISALYHDERIASCLAFKNQGVYAGSSIRHSHSQIVALPFIAPSIDTQIQTSRQHYNRTERCLMCDMISHEESEKTRVLIRNRSFLAFAPFAPRFEFEVWIAPINHSSNFTSLTKDMLIDLGEILEWTLKRIGVALDYADINLLVHTDPPKRSHQDADYFHHIERFFHWHIELLPRIHSLKGVELSSGTYICTIAPEDYATYLKELDLQSKGTL